MVDSHFIAARVSPEMKARLRALAEQRQTSESALLKRLLEMTLEGSQEVQLGNTAMLQWSPVMLVCAHTKRAEASWPGDCRHQRSRSRGSSETTVPARLC